MRKLTASAALSLFGLLGLPVFADVTKEELKKLAAAGVSEDVILSYIRTNGPVVKLSADDLVELKQLGLGDKALAVAVAGPARMVEAPPPVPSRVISPPVTYYSAYEDPYYYRPSYTFGSYYYPSHSYDYSHHRDSSHHSFRGHHGVTLGSHHRGHYGGHSGSHHSGGGHHGGGHHRGGHGGRH